MYQALSAVSRNLAFEGVHSRTESYEELIQVRMQKTDRVFPECGPYEGYNGLTVILDGKVIPADIFGIEESCKYYFPMLRDAAFTLSRNIRPGPLLRYLHYLIRYAMICKENMLLFQV